MPVRAVVRHDVDDRPDAERVALRDQSVSVSQSAEGGVDGAVVGDVVARIGHRGRIPGAEPDRVDAQVPEIGQPGTDASQVAGPVAVAVGEAAHVQLVDGGVAPPGGKGHGSPMIPGSALEATRGQAGQDIALEDEEEHERGYRGHRGGGEHQVLRGRAGGFEDADVQCLPARVVAVLGTASTRSRTWPYIHRSCSSNQNSRSAARRGARARGRRLRLYLPFARNPH